ncbi:Short-chain dehydrogenase/reductase family 16C member 6 [Lucilia cuprina]|nr:Short-chain dehydrogenase/reductase family 16C member 6 [Lucilia cuprina]
MLVSLLINNAGVVSGLHLLDTPDHLIERSFNVNVMAHFWTTKAFLPKMIENQRGHIATIASLAGHVGITKLVDYCASKFAAVGFDEALRLELEVLGHTNIQTTCVCPFFIQQTGMFDDVNAR